jgi:cytochrome c oxidase subunit IV
MESRKVAKLRLGWIVIAGLAVLTALEYTIAVGIRQNVFPYLVVIALAKAGLILQYFMHLAQVWRGEEHR